MLKSLGWGYITHGQAGARGEHLVEGSLWVPEVSIQDTVEYGDGMVGHRHLIPHRHQEPSGPRCSLKAVGTITSLLLPALPSLVTPPLLDALGFSGDVFLFTWSLRAP